MSNRRAQLRRDAREARRRMVVREPIAPIRDHFFEAHRQGTVGCLTVSSFLQTFRHVRQQRRRERRR